MNIVLLPSRTNLSKNSESYLKGICQPHVLICMNLRKKKMLSAIDFQVGLLFLADIISHLIQGDVYVTAEIESSDHIQIRKVIL